MERRNFLKLIGVTGAGAATACDAKTGPKNLIPYLVPPETITPGVPTWYASTCRECPAGCGVHVKTREGRVIKLEGNPDSPVNRGKLCARGQAAHQNLYDPDRLKGPKRLEDGGYVDADWDEVTAEVGRRLAAASGEGEIVLLTGLQTGTRARLYEEWTRSVGGNWIVYEPFAHEALLEANRRVLGRAVIPSYDLAGAEFVISFGADFLGTWVSPVRYGREWAEMHAYKGPGGAEGVFVAVEPRISMTASNADDHLAVPPGTEHLIALGMANVLGAGGDAAEWTPERVARETGVPPERIRALARRFAEGRSVALPGGISAAHPKATAAAVAVALLNQAGGAIGDTVRPDTAVTGGVENAYGTMVDLVARMKTGQVAAILFSETNPAYALPPGLGFEEALRQVPFRVSFDPLFTETASWCHALLPDHTPLESWGDWVPQTGVASLQQPAMRPVFDTRSMPDVLLALHRTMAGGAADGGAAETDAAAGAASQGTTGQAATGQAAAAPSLDSSSWYEYLRAAWRDRAADDAAWAELLKTGGRWEGVAGADVTPAQPAVAASAAGAQAGDAPVAEPGVRPGDAPAEDGGLDFAPPVFDGPTGEDTFALHLFPQLALYDGRGANRPWLQELPDPGSTSTWHTWVEVNPEVAERMDLDHGDVVSLESPYGTVEVPVIVYPGVRADVVAMPLGRGHQRMGRYANMGVNPVRLLPPTADETSSSFAYQSVRVRMEKTGGWVQHLRTQGSDTDHGRDLAEAVPMAVALQMESEHQTVDEAHAPAEALEHGEGLTPARVAEDASEESPYRWGMAISLDACTGCNACVVACQSENNLPFVGPERVAKSRQMHWIRIERYLEEKPDGGVETHHLPMLCQHCGAAPCEPVCPVYATYHNPDGLNVQVYNRCVGTRYCANNCPYKVRYFNWFNYEWPEPLNWGLNPDVTTREGGVMEKCTYCVQRINAAKIAVADEGPDRVIPDGYFQTACQQTCPTDAIVFGNLKDERSRVRQLAESPLAYSALEHLNTRPANFYLRQVNRRLDDQPGAVPPPEEGA